MSVTAIALYSVMELAYPIVCRRTYVVRIRDRLPMKSSNRSKRRNGRCCQLHWGGAVLGCLLIMGCDKRQPPAAPKGLPLRARRSTCPLKNLDRGFCSGRPGARVGKGERNRNDLGSQIQKGKTNHASRGKGVFGGVFAQRPEAGNGRLAWRLRSVRRLRVSRVGFPPREASGQTTSVVEYGVGFGLASGTRSIQNSKYG